MFFDISINKSTIKTIFQSIQLAKKQSAHLFFSVIRRNP
jgi:hypothetical protein